MSLYAYIGLLSFSCNYLPLPLSRWKIQLPPNQRVTIPISASAGVGLIRGGANQRCQLGELRYIHIVFYPGPQFIVQESRISNILDYRVLFPYTPIINPISFLCEFFFKWSEIFRSDFFGHLKPENDFFFDWTDFEKKN